MIFIVSLLFALMLTGCALWLGYSIGFHNAVEARKAVASPQPKPPMTIDPYSAEDDDVDCEVDDDDDACLAVGQPVLVRIGVCTSVAGRIVSFTSMPSGPKSVSYFVVVEPRGANGGPAMLVNPDDVDPDGNPPPPATYRTSAKDVN